MAYRRVYHAMVAYLDDQLDNITGTMVALGLWERMLMVLTSDNGGFVKSPEGGCVTSRSTPKSPWSDRGHGTACFDGEAVSTSARARAATGWSLWLLEPPAGTVGSHAPPGRSPGREQLALAWRQVLPV